MKDTLEDIRVLFTLEIKDKQYLVYLIEDEISASIITPEGLKKITDDKEWDILEKKIKEKFEQDEN